MKYIDKSPAPPELFGQYSALSPTETWPTFCSDNNEIYKELQLALYDDQRGICAYCEVDLIIGDGTGYADFRIEHFHPKSDNHPQWTFRWENLLAVCCGGNRNHIVGKPAGRFTSPDHSCDVPKAEKVLDGIIFNPVQDNVLSEPIFEYKNNGEMFVSQSCPLGSRAIAERTIKELVLSSSAASKKNPALRLVKLRAAVIDGLQKEIAALADNGIDIDEAMDLLAEAFFPNDRSLPWPKFFSCVRWFLGPAAEKRLSAIRCTDSQPNA